MLIKGLMDAMAEYYSWQLLQNIYRGMDYNAEHALYNRHKLFGYGVKQDKEEVRRGHGHGTLRTADVRRVGGRKVDEGDSRRAEHRRAAYDEGCQDVEQDAQELRLHLWNRQKESAPRIFR